MLGAIGGVVYAAGEHGFISAWRGDMGKRSPALVRLVMGSIVFCCLALSAETTRGFWLLGIAGIGAAKMAELVTSSAIEAVRGPPY